MAAWDDLIPEQERQIYELAGYGRRGRLGSRPAVLVVDVTYGFTGERPEPILQSIRTYPASCGENAWAAISHLGVLLTHARSLGVPVIYTTNADRKEPVDWGGWGEKTDTSRPFKARANEIVSEVAPQPGDLVVVKTKPSAFFGTPLASWLVYLRVDTLLVGGGTTSGCVRATVTDAFSYNFRVAVVEECTFDRGATSHKINLFDMHQKYAEVISLADAMAYLSRVGARELKAEEGGGRA